MNVLEDAAGAMAPDQDWGVDLFRPEDAQGVADLFLSVYGKGYPIKTYLDPGKLREENAAGRLISSVARTPRGDIVGHNALFVSAPCRRVYESGAGVVHAAYRGGKGIFMQLCAHGLAVGYHSFGVEGVYGESVCNHVFSQKMTAGLGCETLAVEVDLMPAAAYDREKSASGRVSSLLDFITLRPKPHRVHIPGDYEAELSFIYAGMDDNREVLISAENPPAGAATEIKPQVYDFARVARLSVPAAGDDFEESFQREEKAVLERGVTVIQVWLNLSEPWSGSAVKVLRERGYFLGGVLPRWFDADGLLLQKLAAPPNWEGMQVHFERAKKIVEFVKADWERAAAGR